MAMIDLAEQIDVLFIGVPDPRHLGAVFAFADWGGRRTLESVLPFPDEPDNWWPINPNHWRSLMPPTTMSLPPAGWLQTCLDVRNAFGTDMYKKMKRVPDAYASFMVTNMRFIRSAFYSPTDDRVYMGEPPVEAHQMRKIKTPSGGTTIIFDTREEQAE
jgi:hypothetical protein